MVRVRDIAARRPRDGLGLAQAPPSAVGPAGASSPETHLELPTRQRVTARFRRRLLERVCDGAARAEVARAEQTTRYQVARAFRDGRDGASAA
jgi:hypothetical protein